MLYQRSQFSNVRFRKLLQKRFNQPLSSAITRNQRPVESLKDVRGSAVKNQARNLNNVFGRYYPEITANGGRDSEDSFSDQVLRDLRSNSERFLRQYVDNIFNNQSPESGRRGGVSQSQNYAQIADLINRGVRRNK